MRAAVLALGVLLPVSLGASAEAQQIISIFGQGDGTSSVVFAPDDCGGECFEVAILCNEYGGLEVTVSDFTDEQIAEWLRRDGLTARVTADAAGVGLMPQAITMNLMSGSWDANYTVDAGPDWLDRVLMARSLTVSTIKGEHTYPLREGELANFKQLADACRQ